MSEPHSLIITCEHGGNKVPARYAPLFRGKKGLLQSHRGYDAGALELARRLSSAFKCPLYYSTVTRLLIDLNRSPDNPRRFSEITRALDPDAKADITRGHYAPYREGVESAVKSKIEAGGRVLHISVHSFVPVLRGKTRTSGVGLLYDPKRKREAAFCAEWRKTLLSADASLRVRRNYPYLGVSDGFTNYLRKLFPAHRYLGIELEVNQKYPLGRRAVWRKLMGAIESSLKEADAFISF